MEMIGDEPKLLGRDLKGEISLRRRVNKLMCSDVKLTSQGVRPMKGFPRNH